MVDTDQKKPHCRYSRFRFIKLLRHSAQLELIEWRNKRSRQPQQHDMINGTEFLSYREYYISRCRVELGPNCRCIRHEEWLGAKLAVCEDASTLAHKKKTEKRNLLSLCMTSLFLFELIVCRPIFRLCERKLAQSHRTVSQSLVVRLRHRVLIQARRQFCAFLCEL